MPSPELTAAVRAGFRAWARDGRVGAVVEARKDTLLVRTGLYTGVLVELPAAAIEAVDPERRRVDVDDLAWSRAQARARPWEAFRELGASPSR